MKRKSTSFISVNYRSLCFVVLAALAVTSFLAFGEQASTKDAVVQPASLGKLAFDKTNFATTGLITSSVMAANSDGSGSSTLAQANVPPVIISDPAWSPDGTKLVFVSDSDLWVMNADGSNKTNVTNNNATIIEGGPTWSLGGKIAYERDGQIWTMSVDGTGQTAFSAITQSFPSRPAFSPDGTKLAFAASDDIWVINIDGSNEHRATNNSVPDRDPTWSPDGTKIIFEKAGGISVVNADGSGEYALTAGLSDSRPSWSSDGTKIAFVRRNASGAGIYTMDASGGNQLRILADNPNQPGRSEHNNPAWQPTEPHPNTLIISGRITRNGESLAGVSVTLTGTGTGTTTTNALGEYRFEDLVTNGNYTVTPTLANHIFTPAKRIFESATSNRIADFSGGQTCATPSCRVNGKVAFERGSDIYISNADGTGVTLLTTGGINTDPAFSPDGKQVVFKSNRTGNYEIHRVDVDGTNVVRLTNNTAADGAPAYSPDGSKIVFTSAQDGNIEIYTMNASDGSNQIRLTNNTVTDDEPTFSPDGTKIAFKKPYDATNRTAIYTMNASNGANVVQITFPSTASSIYDQTPSFSPDGTKLLFWRLDGGPFTSEFFVAYADGTNPVTTGITGFVYKPSFSPDGTRVVYSRLFNPFTYNIESAPVAGGGATVMVPNGHHVDWQPLRPAAVRTAFDFDGDGRADISTFRPSDNLWYLNRSELGFAASQWGIATDTVTPADYDGDLKTDIAVWRESDGNFYILNSATSTARVENFGLAGDKPSPQDWDGDGKSDLTVYRAGAQNTFYYRASSNNPAGNITFIPWGAGDDKPVIGDFDGDGRGDAAVYRPSNGVWYVRRSLDGQLSANAFGLPTDKLVPADYDGDGKTDLAVYRAGIWYIQRSTEGFTAFQYGIANDTPVPADYDGDGRANAAIYRSGVWYRLNQNGTSVIDPFGLADDKPIPSAYVR